MVDVQDTLSEFPYELILPLPAAELIQRRVYDFLDSYQRLAFLSEQRGDMLYNNPTKSHWLWHWSRKARFINPRITNCYMDEDFVGKMKVLVHSCSAGTDTHMMMAKMRDKYRYGMHFLARDSA